MRHGLMTRKDWQKRAERMRAIAGATPDEQTIFLLLDLAEEYEKLADEAAVKGAVPQSSAVRSSGRSLGAP
jgi:hypothetical protein